MKTFGSDRKGDDNPHRGRIPALQSTIATLEKGTAGNRHWVMVVVVEASRIHVKPDSGNFKNAFYLVRLHTKREQEGSERGNESEVK